MAIDHDSLERALLAAQSVPVAAAKIGGSTLDADRERRAVGLYAAMTTAIVAMVVASGSVPLTTSGLKVGLDAMAEDLHPVWMEYDDGQRSSMTRYIADKAAGKGLIGKEQVGRQSYYRAK